MSSWLCSGRYFLAVNRGACSCSKIWRFGISSPCSDGNRANPDSTGLIVYSGWFSDGFDQTEKRACSSFNPERYRIFCWPARRGTYSICVLAFLAECYSLAERLHFATPVIIRVTDPESSRLQRSFPFGPKGVRTFRGTAAANSRTSDPHSGNAGRNLQRRGFPLYREV
jgi:hypothetical protein